MKGFKQRKRESKRAGKLRGLGVACYVETTAAMTVEQAAIRFNADGTMTFMSRHARLRPGPRRGIRPGVLSAGGLGVPFDRIRLCRAAAAS